MKMITLSHQSILFPLIRLKLPPQNLRSAIIKIDPHQMLFLNLWESDTRLTRNVMRSKPRKRSTNVNQPHLLPLKVTNKPANGPQFMVRPASRLENSLTSRARDFRQRKMPRLLANKTRNLNRSTLTRMHHREARAVSLSNNRSLSKKRKNLSTILAAPSVETRSSMLSEKSQDHS